MTTAAAADSLEMRFNAASPLIRLVSSAVRVAERAGLVIKDVVKSGELGVVDKSTDGAKDLQTEADRAAQFVIVESLQRRFGSKLVIVGEEEITSARPDIEDGLSEDVLALDASLSQELRSLQVDEFVVWVDPLDGTSEFAKAAVTQSPILAQITVLIGIAAKGKAVAGIVHQPFWGENRDGRTVWAIQGLGAHGLAPWKASSAEKLVVTTRSHSNKLVTQALEALKTRGLVDRVEPVGGAGYKVLRCLEDSTAYVFASAGCKKWDTLAPEAVLEAAGGRLTDVSGHKLDYSADVQRLNSGGVLATAPGVDHQAYVDGIPDEVKQQLPEVSPKQ